MRVNPKVTLLFGTQTGNSEDVAERVGRQLLRIGCKPNVINLKDYRTINLISENLIIFVCSTTGDGEVPDNMKTFWKFLLRKDLPSNSLSSVNFCVFGLGDSSYDKFNVVAKRLNKRLLQLGAIEFIPLTLADDQHELGYDAAFDPWFQILKDKIVNFYYLEGPFMNDDVLLPAKYDIHFTENEPKLECSKENLSDLNAILKENYRMTSPDHFQAVHFLKFESCSTISYNPGDVAVVWPENPSEEVEEFLSLLNVPSDKEFILRSTDPDIPVPNVFSYPCTVRQCVKTYFDFMSIPRRSFFEFLYHFSKDELEKEKLMEFTTALGQEELFEYCNRPRRTILEVMKDFPNTTPHVPFHYFFDMIPQIRPRKFSIASASSCNPNEFHLAVAVVNYRTRLKKPRLGLCSNWLANLKCGTVIPFSLQKGSIALPKDDVPIIMVGPGTGCAPFRAFIQERARQNMKENYLFFGCRYKEKDFLFSSDWNDFVNKGLLNLFTAFSRDQEDKCYVQHKIRENSQLLFDLIHLKGAHIYIAGNAKQMPEGVKNAFADIIEKEGCLDSGEGLKYVQNLIVTKRYHQETWA